MSIHSSSDPKHDKNQSRFQTSYSLIERVRNPSDDEAWKEFFSYYEQYIYNILRHIGISASDTQEITQEIIILLWKKLPEFAYNKDRGKFRQWLSTIIHNKAYSYISKEKRKRKHLRDDESEELIDSISDSPDSTGALDKIIAEEWDLYISNMAWVSVKERFKENMQKVFLLYMQEIPTNEIAKQCDVKEASVHVYVQRIRDHLKEEIQRFNTELL
jgi:RNA polymerase sigma-70 factor (ECF subfamily)